MAAYATFEAFLVICFGECVILAEHADFVVPIVADGAYDTLLPVGWAAISIFAVASDEVVPDLAGQLNLKVISARGRGGDGRLASDARRARSHAVDVKSML